MAVYGLVAEFSSKTRRDEEAKPQLRDGEEQRSIRRKGSMKTEMCHSPTGS